MKKPFKIVPTLRRIEADQAYRGELVQWVKATFSCELEIVRRTAKAFNVLLSRGMKRTLAWLSRYRRLMRVYEKRAVSDEGSSRE
ncbi:MAG TPA: hypothetical protein PKY50_17885 [Candidatus Competibacter sp.]|nr:hypothetical protein [Candidatus Competibacter sp.]